MSRSERVKNFVTDRALSVGSRTGGYLRAGPGGVNFEKIIVYGMIIAGGFVLYKVVKAVAGFGKDAKEGYDRAIKGAADKYVDLTHDGVKLVEQTFVLPSGQRISSKLTTPAGGGKLYYQGALYIPYEAFPPGSGVYKIKKV